MKMTPELIEARRQKRKETKERRAEKLLRLPYVSPVKPSRYSGEALREIRKTHR